MQVSVENLRAALALTAQASKVVKKFNIQNAESSKGSEAEIRETTTRLEAQSAPEVRLTKVLGPCLSWLSPHAKFAFHCKRFQI